MFITTFISRFAPGAFAALIVLAIATDSFAQKNGLGLGVIIGEPTGPCFKFWTGSNTAIDGAVAWSLDNDADLHLHMDYLIHDFSVVNVEKGSLPLYYGVGGRVRFREGGQDDLIGVRIPVGFAYLFANSPLELFLEIVPIVDLAPDTEVDFNGGAGIRFYIGGKSSN